MAEQEPGGLLGSSEAAMPERRRQLNVRVGEHAYDAIEAFCENCGFTMAAFFSAIGESIADVVEENPEWRDTETWPDDWDLMRGLVRRARAIDSERRKKR